MILRNLFLPRYLFALTSNQAFKGIKDPAARSQISSNITENKQKLDTLVDVIFSLSNLEIQYLVALQNQVSIAKGMKISDNMVFSISDERQEIAQYLYQKRWIRETWKEYHILTSLFSDEEDNQSDKKTQKKQKQIYEFELTSIDPTQKIKIIKVIRELLSLGLKDAKDVVDKVPHVFKKGKKEQGEKIKAELQKNGCVITIK